MDRFTKPMSGEKIQRTGKVGGKWSEFIGHFLSGVADRVSANNSYYIEISFFTHEDHVNFFSFLGRRENSEISKSLNVVRGGIGMGKTSFMRWWLSPQEKAMKSTIVDLNNKEDWGGQAAERLPQAVACNLNARMLAKSGESAKVSYIEKFRSNVKQIQEEKFIDGSDFLSSFVSQSEDHRKKYPTLDGTVHLACVVSAIYYSIKKPIWIIVDNVDLETRDMQESLIRSSSSFYENVISICDARGWDVCVHVIVTARLETYFSHRHGSFAGYHEHLFPNPDVRAISQKCIEHAINDQVNYEISRGDMDKAITVNGRKIAGFRSVGEKIKESLNLSISETYWPSHPDVKAWHGAVVDYNVRRFIKHWSHTILTGDFVEDWLFPGDRRSYLNPHAYKRLFIKAGYNEFPGNSRIDASGDLSYGPLIVNVYGVPMNGANIDKYIRNYLVYIRIIQLLSIEEDGIMGNKLIAILENFFDRQFVMDAIKFLLWTRLIKETEIGARNIPDSKSWAGIKIESQLEKCKFCSNASTYLYGKNMVSDFNYLSSMAVVSWQLSNEWNSENLSNLRLQFTSRARILYGFFVSLLEIIIRNIESYKADGTYELFQETWTSRDNSAGPWRSGVSGAIESLKSIINGANSLHNVAAELKRVLYLLERLQEEGIEKLRTRGIS